MGNRQTQIDKTLESFHKTFTSDDFTWGGDVGRTAVNWFIEQALNYSRMLQFVRTEVVEYKERKIPSAYFSGTLLTPDTENSGVTYDTGVITKDLDIDLVKLVMAWATTWYANKESAFRNLETMIQNGVMGLWASNMERLCISGDTTTYSGATDDVGKLLAVNDGWDVLTDDSIIVDAGGAAVSTDLLKEMRKNLPAVTRMNPANLAWIMNDIVADELSDLVSDRATPRGDRSEETGQLQRYLGFPIVTVPLIPIDKSVTTTAETYASYRCYESIAQIQIETGTNDRIELEVDGAGGAQVATLDAGSYSATELANEIESKLNAADSSTAFTGCCEVDQMNRLVLRSPNAGAASSLSINNTLTDSRITNFYTAIGMRDSTPVSHSGSAASSSGTAYDGSFIWLADPRQFVFCIGQQMRAESERNKDYDRTEYVVRQEQDAIVEKPENLVKATNVRVIR